MKYDLLEFKRILGTLQANGLSRTKELYNFLSNKNLLLSFAGWAQQAVEDKVYGVSNK